MKFFIRNARALLPCTAGSDDWRTIDVGTCGPRIDGMAPRRGHGADAIIDGEGLLLLPGIVDIHGDAFERQIQPRPGAVFSHQLALADTDRQLVANGITTACHGLTYSWEGGLRGRDAAVALLQLMETQRHRFDADHRIHLRFENHHVDGMRDALDWISQGRISLVAFNDHLPGIARKAEDPSALRGHAERARCAPSKFRARLEAARQRVDEIPAVVEAIAAACRRYGIPMASHDDDTPAMRLRYRAMEAGISEFPRTREALEAAVHGGDKVVMGAPNVLLGGSHCGALTATEVVRAGQCSMLASDYYYPALLHAPFRLACLEQACTLAQAWRLVSQNPADALGLRDRGRLADGCRADLLLVEASPTGAVKLVATIAAGRLVYCAEPARFTSSSSLPLAA